MIKHSTVRFTYIIIYVDFQKRQLEDFVAFRSVRIQVGGPSVLSLFIFKGYMPVFTYGQELWVMAKRTRKFLHRATRLSLYDRGQGSG